MTARSHRGALAVCWLGLALGLWCGWSQTRVGRVAEDAVPKAFPARLGDRVVHSEEEARFWIGAHEPGTSLRIVTPEGAREVPVVPARSPIHLGLTALSGLAFALACVLAFARRVESEPARSFFWGSFLYSLAIFSGAADAVVQPWFPNLVRPLIRIAALALAPAMFVRIAFVFPRRSPAYDRLRAGHALFVVGSLMALVGVLAYAAAVLAPSAESFARWRGVERAGEAYVVVLVLLGMVQFARNTRTAELSRERQQAKWIWWGVVFGALPYVLFHALPRAAGLSPMLPIEVLRTLTIVIPVSFAIAVVRHQFMDIDVIIRRSLIYGSIAAILTLVYLGAAVVLARLFGKHPGPTSELLGLGAATLAVALFTPTRDLVQRAVDRTFFRLRTDLDRALREFEDDLGRVKDAEDLARRVETFVRATLAPKSVAVSLEAGEASWIRPGAFAAKALHDRTSRPEIEEEALPAALTDAGVVLVQPIPAGDATGAAAGLIVLGEKTSERRYVDEELALLSGLARETGRTFERLELARRAAEEASLRLRQTELEQMRTSFFSQVAHDLRTPLTSIVWSSQNLLDGVYGPLPDPALEHVRSVGAAAGHLRSLVTNLLEIAQLEGGQPALALEPTDARAVVRQAVLVLTPVAEARSIALEWKDDAEAARGDGLPPVVASRDGLTKIALNLIDNALKFSPEKGRVEVALERESGGWQRLTVKDEGPGVPEEERERIWKSYERGSAAAAAALPGFGLGLSVVRGFAERFGGRVEVEAPAAHMGAARRGATFTCRLREWTTKNEETACRAS